MNAFDGLISWQDTAEEEKKISELKDQYKFLKLKAKEKKEKEQNIQGQWNNYKQYIICIRGIQLYEIQKRQN